MDEQKKVIVSNIKKFLKQNKMNQSELADKIGIARSTMSDYMNFRAKPSAGVLEKMASEFKVTKADIDTTYKNKKVEIIDGTLQLVEDGNHRLKAIYDIINNDNKNDNNFINENELTKKYLEIQANNLLLNAQNTDYFNKFKIPIIGKIAAGTPLDAIEDIVDKINPPYDMRNIDNLFGLVVNGDSMNKIVPNGNYAILKKQQEVENGEIAAVIVNGNYATLKKVYKFTDLIILEPCSYDENFIDQKYTKDNCEDIKIIGKFLYSVSPMIQN